jgi:hypothetical protein
MNSLIEIGESFLKEHKQIHGAIYVNLEHFMIELSFSTPDEIREFLASTLGKDFLSLPLWMRTVAYRLICLQDPNNIELKKAAAYDLLSFGRDGAVHAIKLLREIGEEKEADKWEATFNS